MGLGKNAMDKLYSSSKQPFWLANMKIHLILVYWDARNSLFYNLVISFKAGVTFVVMVATQSFQRCHLESEAGMSNMFVSMCHFGADFQNFELKMHTAVVQRLGGGPKGQKDGPKHSFRTPKTIEVNKICILICCTD